MMLEVIAGRRPAGQLAPLAEPPVLRYLRAAQPATPRPRQRPPRGTGGGVSGGPCACSRMEATGRYRPVPPARRRLTGRSGRAEPARNPFGHDDRRRVGVRRRDRRHDRCIRDVQPLDPMDGAPRVHHGTGGRVRTHRAGTDGMVTRADPAADRPREPVGVVVPDLIAKALLVDVRRCGSFRLRGRHRRTATGPHDPGARTRSGRGGVARRRVRALGAGAPCYPTPGPSRRELLDILR